MGKILIVYYSSKGQNSAKGAPRTPKLFSEYNLFEKNLSERWNFERLGNSRHERKKFRKSSCNLGEEKYLSFSMKGENFYAECST